MIVVLYQIGQLGEVGDLDGNGLKASKLEKSPQERGEEGEK